MTIIEMSFLGLVFGAVFGAVLLGLKAAGGVPIRGRLEALGDADEKHDAKAHPWLTQIIELTGPLAKLSLPDNEWEGSLIRTRFMNAGLRNPGAPVLFFGTKTALAVGLPLIVYFTLSVSSASFGTNALLVYLIGAAAIGYYVPNMILKNMIFRRQREIFESFPDALDLMTVCVEAGLGMDAALARVADEIGLKSRILAEELTLVTLELRAGSTKEKALRGLAMRTGVDDVDALVAMLIQAERFGTSIAASLRVQSDQLRTKRRQRAEEQAAKIALKLLFPLIFFIFPSLLVILLGPAFIQIYRVLLPTFGATSN
jgi:tight adherence protein C